MNEEHAPGLRVVDRSRLRPEIRLMLEAADNEPAVDLVTTPAAEVRANAERSLSGYWTRKDPLPGIETFAIQGPGGPLRARLYPGGAGPRAILFFHGGGWVLGSLETHDGPLRALALAAKCKVIAVEYRKAPEAPFPAAIEDAEAALAYARSATALGIDPGRLVTAGDSAGANIAAVLAQRARDGHIPLCGQMLIYPATDARADSGSRREFSSGFFLTRETMAWYLDQYCSDADRASPGVSPLYAKDMSGLPPALIVAADHDPLRDDSRAYAGRLIEAGVDVTFQEWQGMTHGFMIMDEITPAARQLCKAMADWANLRWDAADRQAP
jgi:acetyl esterase